MQPIQSHFNDIEKFKNNDIRINIKKKHRILLKNWSKLENYRSENSIHDTEGIFPQTKKEKIIINKVLKNRVKSSSTY